MKKTYCDRCGKQIVYDPRQQAILPTYGIHYVSSFCHANNSFDLCNDCQIEFINWVGKWLEEKRNNN